LRIGEPKTRSAYGAATALCEGGPVSFWIGIIIGWLTAAPLAVLALALARMATLSDEARRRSRRWS